MLGEVPGLQHDAGRYAICLNDTSDQCACKKGQQYLCKINRILWQFFRKKNILFSIDSGLFYLIVSNILVQTTVHSFRNLCKLNALNKETPTTPFLIGINTT